LHRTIKLISFLVGSGIRKIQPVVEKYNPWLKAGILISCKLQASSLTVTEGYYRMIKKEK